MGIRAKSWSGKVRSWVLEEPWLFNISLKLFQHRKNAEGYKCNRKVTKLSSIIYNGLKMREHAAKSHASESCSFSIVRMVTKDVQRWIRYALFSVFVVYKDINQ